MTEIFNCPRLSGQVPAISSKSEAHRALICAALSDKPSDITCTYTNNDILATVSCLNSLGADISYKNGVFHIEPIYEPVADARLDCGESGSTLRFMLPIVAALGVHASIYMSGRLPQRPLSPLYELLSDNGARLSKQGSVPLEVSGKFVGGDCTIAANISSQFISGLLFALPLCSTLSTITLTDKIESEDYISMTLDAQRRFSVDIKQDGAKFIIDAGQRYSPKGNVCIGGDWSNAAFFLCAGALSEDGVCVSGLDLSSHQGDKRILDVLKSMGADITAKNDSVTVKRGELKGIELDASNIPDLVPIIATVASVSRGKSVIYNAGRLRLKESDRIESVCNMLSSLGSDITPTDDGMVIYGKESLAGGRVDSCSDHRIAMSAAIASTVCKNAVVIDNFEAVNKSYPDFKKHFLSLVQNI